MHAALNNMHLKVKDNALRIIARSRSVSARKKIRQQVGPTADRLRYRRQNNYHRSFVSSMLMKSLLSSKESDDLKLLAVPGVPSPFHTGLIYMQVGKSNFEQRTEIEIVL